MNHTGNNKLNRKPSSEGFLLANLTVNLLLFPAALASTAVNHGVF